MMKYLSRIYYKIHNLLFKEIRKNTNLTKINIAFSRGASTSQLRNIDKTNPISWEFSAFSQNGEDGIIDYLLSNLLSQNRYFIEIGANNCIDNNTGWLAYAKNYSGLMIEGDEYLHKNSIDTKPWYVNYENIFVTLTNINVLNHLALFKDPDVFSLDIDGNDFYIMNEVFKLGFRPKIIVVEYNSCFGPDEMVTIEYKEKFNFHLAHDSGLYYGVSIALWQKHFQDYGYKFITVESNGVNAFFVNPECFSSEFLAAINGKDFLENSHQLRKFGKKWQHQFELIKKMKLNNTF